MIGTTTLAVIAAGFIGFSPSRKSAACGSKARFASCSTAAPRADAQGGAVNFDGIQAGEIRSIKLQNPRKIRSRVMLDGSAPIRKDTVVGIEFLGLTGVAAISLVGGASSAPPAPLDEDGVRS